VRRPGSSITESDTSGDEGPHMISTCKDGELAVSEIAGEDEWGDLLNAGATGACIRLRSLPS